MNEGLFNNNNKIITQYFMGNIIQPIVGNIIKHNTMIMIAELLLLLMGHNRSHVTFTTLCPFQTKTHSNCSELQNRIQGNSNGDIAITIGKYEEDNIDLNLCLNCCKLSKHVISLARQFHS